MFSPLSHRPSPPMVTFSANGNSIHSIVPTYLPSPLNQYTNSHSFYHRNRIFFLSPSRYKPQTPVCSTLTGFRGSPTPLLMSLHIASTVILSKSESSQHFLDYKASWSPWKPRVLNAAFEPLRDLGLLSPITHHSAPTPVPATLPFRP